MYVDRRKNGLLFHFFPSLFLSLRAKLAACYLRAKLTVSLTNERGERKRERERERKKEREHFLSFFRPKRAKRVSEREREREKESRSFVFPIWAETTNGRIGNGDGFGQSQAERENARREKFAPSKGENRLLSLSLSFYSPLAWWGHKLGGAAKNHRRLSSRLHFNLPQPHHSPPAGRDERRSRKVHRPGV